MGWASWNCYRTNISEEILNKQMDALIATGLSECGYEYFNTDDGFFGGRDANGRLLFHKERFPNGIKCIADRAHEKGLKAGIYSDGGDNTCAYYYDHEGENGVGVGLYGHEETDLNMFLDEFGFDFIKVDWCGGVRLGLDEQEQYTKISKIIDEIRHRTNRQLVFNICRWQFPGAWAAEVADSWRTGADICSNFDSVMHQLDNIKFLQRYCKPGHVNDLDMMQIGNGMNLTEEKTHFVMWCMMSTPLMIGCDLTKLSKEQLDILKNKELIALNQDPACIQAFVIKEILDDKGELLGEIWMKELGEKDSKTKAIAFLNRSEKPLDMGLVFEEAGLCGDILNIRDLNLHKNMEIDTNSMKVQVGAHDVKVFKITSTESKHVENKDDKGEYVRKPIVTIDMEEAERLLSEGAVLVDVRGVDQYEKGHLDGAVDIPYSDIHGMAKGIWKNLDTTLIVYCATGKRSSQAIGSLELLGYENVYMLKK